MKASNNPASMSAEDYEVYKKDKSMQIAGKSAATYAGVGGTSALVGMLLANKYNRSFSTYMSISAKTSIPVMTALFLFALQFELKLLEIKRHPKRYGFDDKRYVVETKTVSRLPIHQKAMNYLHEHPFHLIAGLGMPFVATILRQQLALKHLTLSQRIMQSRVMGQAGVITIAMSVMAFKDYMDRRGPFEEPSD
jgi:hypothetical protein